MGMKKHMNEMETVEMLIKMMNEKIAADELATETAVPLMVKRNIHHYTMDDRATMKKAAREHELKLAELRKSEKEKAWKDNELWYVYRLFEGTDRDYYIASEVDKRELWHPFAKAEQHKGLEKSYVAELDSNGNADNDPWAYEESSYWEEYLKAKEMAETIAATEIAEWKETAQFYAANANAFRMEVMMLRDIIKANEIDF